MLVRLLELFAECLDKSICVPLSRGLGRMDENCDRLDAGTTLLVRIRVLLLVFLVSGDDLLKSLLEGEFGLALICLGLQYRIDSFDKLLVGSILV